MRWTLRRRIQLVGAVGLVVGWVVLQQVEDRLQWLRGTHPVCAGTDLGPSPCGLLGPLSRHPTPVLWVALPLAAVAMAVVLLPAAAWCLRPLRELAIPIARMGPTNLGHRVNASGDADLAVVGDAIDAMMARVTAGYEGQRRFAANASHELRTPLSVQRTLIEVGLSAAVTPEQLELLTRQLLATNERNERLIEGLLVLAESDQGLVSRSPQRLDAIAGAVLAAHADRAAGAGLTLTSDLAARTVVGEHVLLERLVINLVQNAVKYNRQGGSVHVRVGADPALSVANTGPAVPAERVAEIFEPFRRLAGQRTDHTGGSGLGLTIARSITTAHDGWIEAVPRGSDGLRVDVHLPLAPALPAVRTGADEHAAVPSQQRR